MAKDLYLGERPVRFSGDKVAKAHFKNGEVQGWPGGVVFKFAHFASAGSDRS